MSRARSFRAIVREATASRRPAVLKEYARSWRALEHWKDIAYLRSALNDREIRIEVGSDYTNAKIANVPFPIFAEYLEIASKNEQDQQGELAYWAQDKLPSELSDDIAAAVEDISTEKYDAKIWCGPNNTLSPLHFDPSHNLFVQVVGSKEVAVAAAGISRVSSELSNQSHNTSSIDAFGSRHADMFEYYTLRPGDAMVVPKKMWHSVRAIEDPREASSLLTMSVSFWWTAEPEAK